MAVPEKEEDKREEHWALYELVLAEQRHGEVYHRKTVIQAMMLVAAIVGGTIAVCGLLDGQVVMKLFVAAAGAFLVSWAIWGLRPAVVRNRERVLKTVSTRAKLEASLGLDRPTWRLGSESKRWDEESVLYPEDLRNRGDAASSEQFVKGQKKTWDSWLFDWTRWIALGVAVVFLILAIWRSGVLSNLRLEPVRPRCCAPCHCPGHGGTECPRGQ